VTVLTTHMHSRLILALPLALALASPGCEPRATGSRSSESPQDKAYRPAGRGRVIGKVTLRDTAPPPRRFSAATDPYCLARHPNGIEVQSVRVADGALADVVIHVKSGLAGSYPLPTHEVILEQRDCLFAPHVLALAVGQPLVIRSADDTLHNVRPMARNNDEFNLPQRRRGDAKTRRFERAELMMPIVCDVHPWMRAYVSVFDHPYFAISAPDGRYEITALPPGEYEIEAVHETLPPQSRRVSLGDGETVTSDFVLESRQERPR
jgi:hypothetical protein